MSVVTLKRNIFKDYLNRYFVETGTYQGDAVQRALDAGFEHCFSIELSDNYYFYAKERFKNNKKVTVIKGDSALILFDWLDGHYSKGDTALGIYCSPLIAELKQIREHWINKHTIIIDDMRLWKAGDPVCKCEFYPCTKIYGFDKNDIINSLLEINLLYNFEFIDGYIPNDILIAKP